MTYTNEEIQTKIKSLENKQSLLKLKRTDLSKQINEFKKQIEYWQSIDESQIKMFD